MSKLIYSLAIHLYKGLFFVIALFNSKAKAKIDGIRTTRKSLLSQPIPTDKKVILIHCASQGEHEQALPIIRWIIKETNYTIVLSFFSPSGYENSNYENNSRLIKTYLPFDLPKDVSVFIKSIQPSIAIIIKNEWWWNLLQELKSSNVLTYLVSATIRKEHYFIKYPNDFFVNSFKAFQAVFVVDDDSYKNIRSVYKGKLVEAGDTRIDQTNYIKESLDNSQTGKSDTSQKTIIYGSVWNSDIEVINHFIKFFPNANHLIFPHELNKKNIELFKNEFKGSICLNNTGGASQGVNIITKMGQLKYAYELASMAYIGGGFGVGIHNILEAAVFYIPTLFGPNYQKSNEAKDLISKRCSFSFDYVDQLSSIFQIINEEKNGNEIEMKLKSYFSPKYSPTEIICREIFKKKDINV